MKHLLTFKLFVTIACSTAISQTSSTREFANHRHAWLIWNGTLKLNDAYSVFYDFQFRRAELGESWQQRLLRSGLLYQATEFATFALGYAHVETYRYGEFPVLNNFGEHRAWQQLLLRQKFQKSTLSHRYRIEQRWIGDSNMGGFRNPRYENRVRYLMRYNFPLFKMRERQIYAVLSDEVMLNFGRQVGRNLFDQNRLAAQLGISISPKINVECGYMNQLLQQRGTTTEGKNKIENNHTATLTVTGNF